VTAVGVCRKHLRHATHEGGGDDIRSGIIIYAPSPPPSIYTLLSPSPTFTYPSLIGPQRYQLSFCNGFLEAFKKLRVKPSAATCFLTSSIWLCRLRDRQPARVIRVQAT
jgi:hypothetical protein